MNTQEASPLDRTPDSYPHIICTVDVVLMTLHEGQLKVALSMRDKEPFSNQLALPGGYVRAQSDTGTLHAARRVLEEKAGLQSPYLEQLATFSGPDRDPRGWSVSVVYYALVPYHLFEKYSSAKLTLVPVDAVKDLPFDHNAIIACAVQRVRDKSTYSSLPVYLCPPLFTLPQLQAVYETLRGTPINKVSFRRKMDEVDFLEPVPNAFEDGVSNRPAQLYRLKREAAYKLVVF